MRKSALLTSMLVLALSAFLSGCGPGTQQGASSDGGDKAPSAAVSSKPVTLTLFNMAGMEDEKIQNAIISPVQAKFPNIHLNYVKSAKGSAIEDLVSEGNIPDLIIGTVQNLRKLIDLQTVSDLTPLIKQQNFDLNRLQSGIIETFKAYSDNGEIYGLPFEFNPGALYYNKDIFDKFGVPYPKDGMTWDQLYDLAQKVTRTDGDTKYRGFDFRIGYLISSYNQLGLTPVDKSSGKVLVNNDDYHKLFNNFARFYKIPGNEVDSKVSDSPDAFNKDKNVAMWAGQLNLADKPGMNWDLVSLPVFSQNPGVGTQLNAGYFAISPTSKNKDQAFQVVANTLTDSIVADSAKMGSPGTLKSIQTQQNLGVSLEYLKGKNVQALFKNKIALPKSPPSKYADSKVNAEVEKAFKAVKVGQKDTNTALREAEEAISKYVGEQQAAGK